MKTILVADDFKSLRNFLIKTLESKGYRAVGVSDGYEAFQILLMNPGEFDLVVADYNMPGCSGLDLLKMIKTNPQVAKTPVVFFTTENSPEKIQKAKSEGLSDWIRKPYKAEMFFSKLEQVIDNNPI